MGSVPEVVVPKNVSSTGNGAWHKETVFVPSPSPSWTPGTPQPSPYADKKFLSLNPNERPQADNYALCISAVVPRPIGFVSSLSKEGVGNLAPYSFFNVVAFDPPCVTLGICWTPVKENGKKDTLANIEETGEFVVNIISDWFVEAANYTCGLFDRGVDEMKLSGLTPVPQLLVKPPRVRESAFQMECKVRHTYELVNSKGATTTTIVVGEVVMFHVNEGVVGHSPSGKVIVDFPKFRPMTRLGATFYGRSTEYFDVPRPDQETAKAVQEKAKQAQHMMIQVGQFLSMKWKVL